MTVIWQRAAAYVVLKDADARILLTRFEVAGHRASGSWTLPGGGMEWGEQAVETATRELREETDLTATIGSLLGSYSEWTTAENSHRGHSGHSLKLIFAASDPAGDLKRDFSDDDTTVDAAWFSLGDVQSLRRVPVVDFALTLIER